MHQLLVCYQLRISSEEMERLSIKFDVGFFVAMENSGAPIPMLGIEFVPI